MKNLFAFTLLILFSFSANTYGQRYRTMVFPPEYIARIDIPRYTATTTTYSSAAESNMSLYLPFNTVDFARNRPLIVMVHGGGFEARISSTTTKEIMDNQARIFAAMGYVVANINYRLYNRKNITIEHTGPFGITYTTVEYNDPYGLYDAINAPYAGQLPWYVATQDLNAAVHYLSYNAANLGIDKNKIFIYGESAGAVTSLAFALNNPTGTVTSLDFPAQSNGDKFEDNPQVGDLEHSTIPNCKSQVYQVLGVASLSGGLVYDDFLTESDQMPIIFQHNIFDPVVKFKAPDTRFLDYAGPDDLIKKMQAFNQANTPYPCSYLYQMNDFTYSDGTNVHLMNTNAKNLFCYYIANFFADIFKNTTDCDETLTRVVPNCKVRSSLNPGNIDGGRLSTEGDVNAADRSSSTGGISLFPNPVQDQLTIQAFDLNAVKSIQVVDAKGMIQDVPWNGGGIVDMSGLSPGLYFVRVIETSDVTTSFKVVKQ